MNSKPEIEILPPPQETVKQDETEDSDPDVPDEKELNHETRSAESDEFKSVGSDV